MFKLILATFGLTIPAFCLGGDVKAFAARDADYARYKTFRWMPSKALTKTGVVEDDPTLAPLIARSVKEQLVKKGLVEVSEEADLEVVTWALAVSVPQIEALIFAPFEGTDWGTSPITTIGRYNRQGSLIVNLIDTRTNKSLWAGMATRAIGKNSELSGPINKAAAELFKQYPLRK